MKQIRREGSHDPWRLKASHEQPGRADPGDAPGAGGLGALPQVRAGARGQVT